MSAPKSRVDTVPTRPPSAPVDSDLGSVHVSVPPGTPAVEAAERRAAALTVTSSARTADEAREWLQMLGLIPTVRQHVGKRTEHTGTRVARCPHCKRLVKLTLDGLLTGHRTTSHSTTAPKCDGYGQPPEEET